MKSNVVKARLVDMESNQVLAGSYPFVRFVPLEGDELFFKINDKNYSGFVESRTIDARDLSAPGITLHLTDVKEMA